MSQNDPTDTALAAIASIFGPARPADGDEEGAQVTSDERRADHDADHPADAEAPAEIAAVTETAPDPGIDGYSRSGPGPLDSLRFKWTARRGDDGEYYVDETIGYASRPIASGPIPRDQVIAYIDGRESAARQRFDALRSEMIRGATERGNDALGSDQDSIDQDSSDQDSSDQDSSDHDSLDHDTIERER